VQHRTGLNSEPSLEAQWTRIAVDFCLGGPIIEQGPCRSGRPSHLDELSQLARYPSVSKFESLDQLEADPFGAAAI
jgi:hypothetical protein